MSPLSPLLFFGVAVWPPSLPSPRLVAFICRLRLLLLVSVMFGAFRCFVPDFTPPRLSEDGRLVLYPCYFDPDISESSRDGRCAAVELCRPCFDPQALDIAHALWDLGFRDILFEVRNGCSSCAVFVSVSASLSFTSRFRIALAAHEAASSPPADFWPCALSPERFSWYAACSRAGIQGRRCSSCVLSSPCR